jgi:hypothetical protein
MYIHCSEREKEVDVEATVASQAVWKWENGKTRIMNESGAADFSIYTSSNMYIEMIHERITRVEMEIHFRN